MASWPSILPAPQYDGYGINPVDQTVSTDMEGGNTAVRRRTKAVIDKIPCTVKMNRAQFAAFRGWFQADDGAAGGSAWFTIDLLTGYGSVDIQNVEARFAGVWTAGNVQPQTIVVSLQLEVRYA